MLVTAYPDQRRAYPADAVIGSWHAPDGWELRTFDRPGDGERGSILWLGGRGDIFEKYLECFAQWHDAGWSVTSFDWRGQGGSGRLLPDRRVGHIDDFAIWIDDLAAFWTDWVARMPAPHVVMGHSMGGHLVLRALIERRIAPVAVVLSAPMLGFEASASRTALTKLAVRVLARVVPHALAWKENERPGASAPRATYLTHDDARYADELWWRGEQPDLALGPPSWGWMGAALRSYQVIDAAHAVEGVAVPVCIVATDGDQLVSPAAIRAAATRLPNCDLLMFDKTAAHEVLREVDVVRDAGLARIEAFLDQHA